MKSFQYALVQLPLWSFPPKYPWCTVLLTPTCLQPPHLPQVFPLQPQQPIRFAPPLLSFTFLVYLCYIVWFQQASSHLWSFRSYSSNTVFIWVITMLIFYHQFRLKWCLSSFPLMSPSLFVPLLIALCLWLSLPSPPLNQIPMISADHLTSHKYVTQM